MKTSRPARRAAPLAAAPALFALTACGVAPTGVVEAGGPAHGIRPTVSLYFFRDDTLVAVPRPIEAPVDVRTAVELLHQGPSGAEQLAGLTTALTTMPFAAVRGSGAESGAESAARAVQAEGADVTSQGDTVSVGLRFTPPALAPVADQVICTVVSAHFAASPDATSVTVTVTGPDGRRVTGSGERCPGL